MKNIVSHPVGVCRHFSYVSPHRKAETWLRIESSKRKFLCRPKHTFANRKLGVKDENVARLCVCVEEIGLRKSRPDRGDGCTVTTPRESTELRK